VDIRETKQDERVLKDKVRLDTKFGFIKFVNSEEAKAAL
jgi:hypothetical protein